MLQSMLSTAYTLFLFTKSDIKTTVIPGVCFSIGAAPSLHAASIPHVVGWLWIHLLQFDISNQTLQLEEDLLNKSERPLPSNRISLKTASYLRWALIPICWTISWCYSAQTLYASVSLIALTVLYNELSAHKGGWIFKNLFNAAGYAAFETGATLVATKGHRDLDWVSWTAIGLSVAIIATTGHTQDFKDIHGDRAVGRRTIPIVFPSFARATVVLGTFGWSLILASVWSLHAWIASIFIPLSLLVGYRFLTLKTVRDDQVSFYWYNIWLSMAHSLPGYFRLVSSGQGALVGRV